MNNQNELELFFFMLGIISGWSAATLIYLYKLRSLKRDGQHLIDKLTAKKQVDFFYNESIRLFLTAVDAQNHDDWPTLEKIAEQHELAVRRFEEARLNLLTLETKT